MIEKIEKIAMATGEAIEGSISRPHNFRPDSPYHVEEMRREAGLHQREAEVSLVGNCRLGRMLPTAPNEQ